MGIGRWALRGAIIVGASTAGVALAQVPVGTAAGSATMAAPAALWTTAAARDLADAIGHVGEEGLRPADYWPALLEQALAGGPGPRLDAVARMAGNALAHDLLLGRIVDRAALDWHIRPADDEAAALTARLDEAVARGEVRAFLAALLPADPRYAALRDALPRAQTPGERDMIRANLERWRWMPRDLGSHYLYVNVPSYRLQVVEDGVAASSYTVVVGAPATPTPQLASDTQSLVVNPWWNVPQSIVKSAALRPGRAGYVFKASADGEWQVRQPPGPANSLGRIKFNLDNDQAIYLHDTPAKAAFARAQRALSHGCIRVQHIDRLANELMEDDDRAARLDTALAGSTTATLSLPKRWRVYLVYFTMDAGADGKLVRYGDPYHRDAAVVAGLDGGALQIASN